jgi:hypothetical protein
LGEDWGGRSPETNVVGKPPSTVAEPPQRIRLEAVTEASSLDTSSTPASVPIERLCFVDISGEGHVLIGSDPPLQLAVWATVSKRRGSTIFAAPTPHSSREIHSNVTNASYPRQGVVHRAECLGSWRTSMRRHILSSRRGGFCVAERLGFAPARTPRISVLSLLLPHQL